MPFGSRLRYRYRAGYPGDRWLVFRLLTLLGDVTRCPDGVWRAYKVGPDGSVDRSTAVSEAPSREDAALALAGLVTPATT